MTQTETRSPRLDRVHSAMVDPATGDMFLRLIAADERIFCIHIAQEAVAPALVGMRSHVAKHIPPGQNPAAREVAAQPFTLTGVRPLLHDQTTPGVALFLDSGIEAPVPLPGKSLAGLRSALAKAEGFLKKIKKAEKQARH